MSEHILTIITAGTSSLGFAAIYNVRGIHLVFPVIGGIIARLLYIILSPVSSEIVSTFIAVVFLSFYTELSARIIKTPTTTFLIPNIIIFIPGGLLYQSIRSFMTGDTYNFLFYSKRTLLIAAAISAAIISVSSVIKLINNHIRN